MTVASTRRAALGAIFTAPLATVSAGAAAPSDLARACDAAITRMLWVNSNDEPDEAWPDERVTAEVKVFDAVLLRVAKEPARGRADLSAKARILLYEYREQVGSHSLNPAEAAMVTLLQEVAACA